MMNRKVVVVSRSYEATLGIARSLAKGGLQDIDLYFVGDAHVIADKSNIFANRYFSLPNQETEEEIVARLKRLYDNGQEPVVLFAGDDYATSLLDRYRDRFSDKILFTYIDGKANGAITEVMDKRHQTLVAQKMGVRMARSWEVECTDGAYRIPDDLTYPCFVKPLLSANGPAKSIIRRRDTYKELMESLESMVRTGRKFPLLIQEYIPIREEYNVHGICDGERIYLPIIHKKLVTGCYNKGVTVVGQNMSPDVLEPHLSQLKRMLQSYGYHGIFNVEMIVSDKGVYLNEINFRIAGTCWGSTGAGTNIPKLWVDVLLGEAREWPHDEIRYGSVFINDKTALEDLTKGNCRLSDYIRWNRQSEYHLIKDDSDPAPWKAFLGVMMKQYVNRKTAGLKALIKRMLRLKR